MTNEIRVAFVGGGLIAKAHAAAQRALPVYFPDLRGCDRSSSATRPTSWRRGGHEARFEESATGWAETVRRADVDAVVVATPPDLHHDVVLAALAAGSTCSARRTLARTAPEAHAM